MKTLIYLVLLSIFSISCDSTIESELADMEKSEVAVFSYAFFEKEKSPDFEVISLDAIQNFGELYDKMARLSCENKGIGLQFQVQDTIYGLIGYSSCPTSNVTSCYFQRNIILIKNDSLVNFGGDWDIKVPIKNLGGEIKKITAMDYNFRYNRNILKPALIHLYIEDKYPISKTKEVLRELTCQFKKLNSQMGTDYFRYTVLFDGYSMMDIPPPPPPPASMLK